MEEKEVGEEEEVIPKGSKVLRENLCGLSPIGSGVLSSPAFSISVRRWRFGGERFHLDLPETFLHLQGRLERGTKMLRNQARGQSERQLSKIYSILAQ